MPESPSPSRRARRAVWRRNVRKALIYAWLPLIKLLDLFGLWAPLIGRGSQRMVASVRGYGPTAHDVVIASYFKSGTTWTLQMALQVTYRGHAEYEHIHDLVPWPEMPPRVLYAVSIDDDTIRRKAPTGLRVVKTHLRLGKLPWNRSARYVCVARDPKDVFVSSYHFLRSATLGPLMPSVQDWLDVFLSRHTPFGSWAEHLQDGWIRRHDDNVLFMTYEEAKKDMRGAISRIAALMDVSLTADELDSVVAQSSYEHMKSIGHKFDMPGGALWSDDGAMIRQGQSGRSGELLSAADQQRIDAYWRNELASLGSDFPYDEHFA